MKKPAVALSLLVLTPLVVCLLAVGYFLVRREYLYRRDVDILTATVAQLGYSADNQINFYASRATFGAYDLIAVVFYSPDSLEQFSDKVNGLGFAQMYYFANESLGYFLEFKVNHGPPKKIVTLNGRYTYEDFGVGVPTPKVTEWTLKDSERRVFSVFYGQPPSAQEVWLYDGKPLSGNIIVVVLDRQSGK